MYRDDVAMSLLWHSLFFLIANHHLLLYYFLLLKSYFILKSLKSIYSYQNTVTVKYLLSSIDIQHIISMELRHGLENTHRVSIEFLKKLPKLEFCAGQPRDNGKAAHSHNFMPH